VEQGVYILVTRFVWDVCYEQYDSTTPLATPRSTLQIVSWKSTPNAKMLTVDTIRTVTATSKIVPMTGETARVSSLHSYDIHAGNYVDT